MLCKALLPALSNLILRASVKKTGPGLLFLPVKVKNRGSGSGILALKEKDMGRACAVISQGMHCTQVAGSLDLEPGGPGLSPGSPTYLLSDFGQMSQSLPVSVSPFVRNGNDIFRQGFS